MKQFAGSHFCEVKKTKTTKVQKQKQTKIVWFFGRPLVHAFLLSKSSTRTTILPGLLHGTGRASHDEEQSIPEKRWGRVTRDFGWELPDLLNELDDNGRWKGNVTIRRRSLMLEISPLPQDKLPRIRLLQTLQALANALLDDDFFLWVTRAFRTQHCLDQVNHPQTNADAPTKPLDMRQFSNRLQLEYLHVSPMSLVHMPKNPSTPQNSYCNPYVFVAEDGKVVQSMSFHAQVGVQGYHLDDMAQLTLSGNGTMTSGNDYGWTPTESHCYEWNDDNNLYSYLMQPSDLPEALQSIGGVTLRDLDAVEHDGEMWEQYLPILWPGNYKGQYTILVMLHMNDDTFALENDTASPQELENFRQMLDCLSKLLYEESFLQQIHGRFHDEKSLQEANERIAFNLACSSSGEDTTHLPDYPMTMETYKSLIEIASLNMYPESCSSDGSPSNDDHEGNGSKTIYRFDVELGIDGICFDDQPMGIGGLILGPNQYEFDF